MSKVVIVIITYFNVTNSANVIKNKNIPYAYKLMCLYVFVEYILFYCYWTCEISLKIKSNKIKKLTVLDVNGNRIIFIYRPYIYPIVYKSTIEFSCFSRLHSFLPAIKSSFVSNLLHTFIKKFTYHEFYF